MTRWSLAVKKLSPARKAWKGFITKIQPQLQKLVKNTLPKGIKATTKRLLTSLRSFLPSRLRPILDAHRRSTNYPNTNYRYYSHQYYYNNKNTLHKSFAAIHIDELFDGTTMSTTSTKNKNNILRDHNMHAEAGTSAHNSSSSSSSNNNNNNIKKGHEGRDMQRSKSIYSVEDAWNAVVAASPQLRCVDERAEEFIYKVKQDMRLQKEKSFEEMLARGAY